MHGAFLIPERRPDSMKIDVLGTKYDISIMTEQQDDSLKDCDGYCDKTVKKIVVAAKRADYSIGDYGRYMRKVMRHEIIHAFLFESGLQENRKHEEWGQDETTVDWFAVQFPKLMRAFESAECLD